MRRTEPSRALTPRGQALIVHRDAEVAGVVVGATFRASLGNDFAGIAVAERSAASLGWTSALSLRGPDLGRCVAAAALSVFRFSPSGAIGPSFSIHIYNDDALYRFGGRPML